MYRFFYGGDRNRTATPMVYFVYLQLSWVATVVNSLENMLEREGRVEPTSFSGSGGGCGERLCEWPLRHVLL